MRCVEHWLPMAFTMAGVNELMGSPPRSEVEGLANGGKRLGTAFVSIANEFVTKSM